MSTNEHEIEDSCCAHCADKHSHEHENEISNTKTFLSVGGIIIYIIAIISGKMDYLGLGMYLLAYLLLGYGVILRAARNLKSCAFLDENFLMSIATIGAFFINDYKEAVAVMLFYQVGEYFQNRAVGKSRKSIKDLMNLKSEYANLLLNGEIVKKTPEEVEIGDTIIVMAGEKIPVDGVVIDGQSLVDTSSITGESVHREVHCGSEILSGTINVSSVIKINATSKYENSTVFKIMEMVEKASSRKSKTERFITKFSRIYTPVVVACAVMVAFLPPIVLGYGFSNWISPEWIRRALVFLVSSCPCALVISVPLSYFSGIGAASKNGILVKGGNYLEALGKVNTVVFDKTGTLTRGVFEVNEITPTNGYSKNDVLKFAYLIERYSNHPISKSIVNVYNFQPELMQPELVQPELIECNNINEISGKGLTAEYNEKQIAAGNKKLMSELNIQIDHTDEIGTVVYIVYDKKHIGTISISDKPYPDAKRAVDKLKELGIKDIYMLTGDRKQAATKIANELGIDKFYYELLPNEKVDKIEEIFHDKDAVVAFIGDGINDAPVLSRADVGFAMGGVGSEAAVEAADIVLMNDEPSRVADAIIIAKKTNAIALQNIVFSLVIKVGVLILSLFNLVGMEHAVFADVGVTLIAVLNSMRRKI